MQFQHEIEIEKETMHTIEEHNCRSNLLKFINIQEIKLHHIEM